MAQPLKVKIKRLHPDAVIPKYAKDGDAGMDLVATSVKREADKITYGTGLAFEIPSGYVGLIFPRSSIRDKDVSLTNSVGVIDSIYRGEVMATFILHYEFNTDIYYVGERIGQMIIMPYPQVEFEETDELSTTERGAGGFGSTGA